MSVGRFLRRATSTPKLTAIVVVPAPPLAPKNTIVFDSCPPEGDAARRVGRPLQRLVERAARGRPREELVRARAHRVQDEIGIRLGRHEKDDGDRMLRPQPLDRLQRAVEIDAAVYEDDVGRSAGAGRCARRRATPALRSSAAVSRRRFERNHRGYRGSL